MTVRAQISFAREPHAWPKEGLAISVRLIDEEGYEVPEEFSVSCKVTVNIAPTEPSWERTGSTLHTLLERPESNGPWMVRVEVADESGIPLGKDFTEVAYAAPPARPDPQQKARREPEPRQRLAR